MRSWRRLSSYATAESAVRIGRGSRYIRTPSRFFVIQLQLAAERAARDPEQVRRALMMSAGLFEHLEDHPPFDSIEIGNRRIGLGRGRLPGFERQIARADLVARAQHGGLNHDVAQLAYVP